MYWVAKGVYEENDFSNEYDYVIDDSVIKFLSEENDLGVSVHKDLNLRNNVKNLLKI